MSGLLCCVIVAMFVLLVALFGFCYIMCVCVCAPKESDERNVYANFWSLCTHFVCFSYNVCIFRLISFHIVYIVYVFFSESHSLSFGLFLFCSIWYLSQSLFPLSFHCFFFSAEQWKTIRIFRRRRVKLFLFVRMLCAHTHRRQFHITMALKGTQSIHRS